MARENGRNLEKNLPSPRFIHHETHMRHETETRTRDTCGMSLHHEATRAYRIPFNKVLYNNEYDKGDRAALALDSRELIFKYSMYVMYVNYSARWQVRPSTCTTKVVPISVY